MGATVWADIPYQMADMAHMAEKLRVSEDDIDDFRPIYEVCARIAKPKFCFREANIDSIDGNDVQIGGQRFHSRVLAVNMRGVRSVYAYVCTCGRELYEFSQTQSDPLFRYWVDAISEQLMALCGIGAHKRLIELAGGSVLYSMNPGSLPDWPLSQQRPLFDLIGDVRERIGVELKESFLMLPEKSGSGLYFASEEEFVNCELCGRDGCPKRRKPFHPGKFEEKYGS